MPGAIGLTIDEDPETTMLLAIDVGNTNTVVGLYDLATDRRLASWRAATRADRMPDEWFALLAPLFAAEGLEPASVRAVIVSSGVPSVTVWLGQMARTRLGVEPVLVTVELDLGFRVLTDNPREVGADRLANTAAAFARYGGPAIVVDFGTATNFDVVSKDGDFLGGAIAPGLAISAEALTGRAAQLFTVALTMPDKVIGTNTVTNLQAGLLLGYLGLLEGMIARIRKELGTDAPVIVTGGQAELFAGASPLITHYDPDLTLDGLNVIYRRVAGLQRDRVGKTAGSDSV